MSIFSMLFILAFAFFLFTPQGEQIFYNPKFSAFLFVIAGFLSFGNAFAFVTSFNLWSGISAALWGYVAFQAFERSKDFIRKIFKL